MPWTCCGLYNYVKCSLWVWLWLIMLTRGGFMFSHIYWIGCHILTHTLNRVSHFDTYIESCVTFSHIYWILCHVWHIHIWLGVTLQFGYGIHGEPLVAIMFKCTCHRYWELIFCSWLIFELCIPYMCDYCVMFTWYIYCYWMAFQWLGPIEMWHG